MGIFGSFVTKKEDKEPYLTPKQESLNNPKDVTSKESASIDKVSVESVNKETESKVAVSAPADNLKPNEESVKTGILTQENNQMIRTDNNLQSVPRPDISLTKEQPIVEKTLPQNRYANPQPYPNAQSHASTKQEGTKTNAIECYPLGKINSVNFSDVYITPDKKTYIWGGKTNAGLMEVSFEDFADFLQAIETSYVDNTSYLLQYKGRNYRVERTIATGGPQFCARKMPTAVPNLKDLGLPSGVYNHLISLAGCSGLILLAGATGSGKSTTIAALMKEYLSQEGGYAFTIEDPVELPLDGIYITPKNEIGLCKQTVPPNGSWEEGIKSALRSKPRYIYLGEIRSPDIASEALRAATSGHLVLSSIHANNVNEAVNSLVKYAAASGISESMAYELVAGGLLGIVHQILSGAPKRAQVTTLFANPDVNVACQVRGMIRSGKLNMATLMEQQKILLQSNKPLFH